MIVDDALRPADARDTFGIDRARTSLDTSYAWLDTRIGDAWATGAAFTLADCAAAPALFYADWTHAIDARFERLLAYRSRLLARLSVARVVDEARPYRHLFPLGGEPRE